MDGFRVGRVFTTKGSYGDTVSLFRAEERFADFVLHFLGNAGTVVNHAYCYSQGFVGQIGNCSDSENDTALISNSIDGIRH